MERSEIIRRFLVSGHQLTTGTLDALVNNQETVEPFHNYVNQEQTPQTIDLEFLNKFLLSSSADREAKFTPDDYANIFSRRFEIIKNIFSQRTAAPNLISINKISQRTKEFTIIGLVKDVLEGNSIILEDKTGEVEIKIEDKNVLGEVVQDEVLVVSGKNSGGIFEGEKVNFPDIPMKRDINRTKSDARCLFISDIHMDSDSFNKEYYGNFIKWLEQEQEKINIFVAGDISNKPADVEKFISDIPKQHSLKIIMGEIDPEMDNILSNPTTIEHENVNLFLFHSKNLNEYVNLWGSPEKAMMNLTKKRHFNPTFKVDDALDSNDPYLLEKIPDIVVAGHTHMPSSTNYKGTTLLTTGSFISQPIFWLINLRTREIFKKDFS